MSYFVFYIDICLYVRDGPFEFLGGGGGGGGGAGLFLVRPSFFFFCRKTRIFFFDRLKDRILFFGQSESSFFLDNHMNHHRSLIRTCISNFSFINLV